MLAALARLRMLEGVFSEAQRLAKEAIRVARACEPLAREHEIHATTTLGVAMAWGSDPEGAIDLLRQAENGARAIDDPDLLFRITANLTTVLDLVGRRSDAVEVAYRGIDEARAAGLEAVYGNFLAGNVAETLILLGRWSEARSLCLRALRWAPVGVIFLDALIFLTAVEIETEAGEEAGRLLGQTVLEFDALREPQLAGSYYLVAASFSLWRGDVGDASRSVERGWAVVKSTEEWVLAARMAAMVAQVDAAVAAEAREHRQLAPLAAARTRTTNVITAAAAQVRAGAAPPTAGSRRIAEAYLATARAYQRRLEGDDRPAVWGHVADAWTELSAPYDAALARWREAEASLSGGAGRTGRADARRPIEEAARVALELHARPLLREIRELAGRARLTLPAAVETFLGETPAAPIVALPVGPAAPPARRRRGRPVRARSSDRPRPVEHGPSAGHLRAQQPRARGAGARGPGPDQPRDRGAAVHQPEDGRRPRGEHPGQACGLRPGRGGDRRDPAGPHDPELASQGPGHRETRREGLRVSIGSLCARPDGLRPRLAL